VTQTALIAPSAIIQPMTRMEAQRCVDEINLAAQRMGRLLLELKEREGWKALGYNTWTACLSEKFSYGRQYLYDLMTAAPVQERLELSSIHDKIPISTAVTLAHFPLELQVPIVKATLSRHGSLTESRVREMGEIMTQMVLTGHVDPGDGFDSPVELALQQSDGEREKRKYGYIAQSTGRTFVGKLVASITGGIWEFGDWDAFVGQLEDGGYELRVYRLTADESRQP